jgi:hypothetical protein
VVFKSRLKICEWTKRKIYLGESVLVVHHDGSVVESLAQSVNLVLILLVERVLEALREQKVAIEIL